MRLNLLVHKPASLVTLALVVCTGLISPALAQTPMTVGEFLTRAEAVRGPLSTFSPERRVLMAELGAQARSLRRTQATPATRDPRLCLPERAELDLQRLMSDLRRMPASDRALPLRDGFRRSMIARYPC